MTQDEIDRMVASIRNRGPVDALLDSLRYVGLEAELSLPEITAAAAGILVGILVESSGVLDNRLLRHLLGWGVAVGVTLLVLCVWRRLRSD